MKVTTRITISLITGETIEHEWFEYQGPIALCGRSESKAVANQGMAQSAEDQANARAALANTNAAIGSFNKRANDFMTFGRRTYGPNGEFLRDANSIANTTAAAGTTALKGNLALNAMRTGENTSGYAGTVAESQRQSQRDLTDKLASADADRLSKLTAIEGIGLDASKFPAEVYSGLYGTGTSGSASQLGHAATAAQTPGFWDTFLPALAGSAATVAQGFAGKPPSK